MSIETLKAAEQALLAAINSTNQDEIFDDFVDILDNVEIELMGIGFNEHTERFISSLYRYLDIIADKVATKE